MTPEERWEWSSPEPMLEMSLHSERGPMVIDDLQALPRAPLIAAEGSTLPAYAVSSGIADRSRAVWLLPTPEFYEAQLASLSRGPRELYRVLAAEIAREAEAHGAPTLIVDGSGDVDETVTAVERRFAEALATGPHAETHAERQALLREANLAAVEQVRAYYSRPWAEGDADTVIRTFLCECGDPSCVASVDVDVGSAADAPVLEASH
jgi:hypothetical protein